MAETERRKTQRYSKSYVVNVHLVPENLREGETDFDSVTRDISLGGAYIYTYANPDLEVELNSPAFVKWIYPSDDELLVKGFICRIDSDGVGIMFEGPQKWIRHAS